MGMNSLLNDSLSLFFLHLIIVGSLITQVEILFVFIIICNLGALMSVDETLMCSF